MKRPCAASTVVTLVGVITYPATVTSVRVLAPSIIESPVEASSWLSSSPLSSDRGFIPQFEVFEVFPLSGSVKRGKRHTVSTPKPGFGATTPEEAPRRQLRHQKQSTITPSFTH
ncbi:hypothetical protein PR003_g3983 [Phytophthora rubi]|uniref:Uncharacterized protein n=1 Tax=Phytophthora rubi TaxID=129364 RepID=A0A6A3P4G6_9STRA|nr:hypothetical protein PR002_g3837 [Phytophthora rubi]KAE9048472.1 hypothetical protein PR001_g3792 [Phytophthora rubi]KAE9353225.1 hypothetical protein PR003_g3983 [Phytophthora rubi]